MLLCGGYIGPVNRPDDLDRLVQDLEARQRNTLWPDAMVNGSSVDELLIKGSPKATKVQRVGIAIWGLLFLCFGAIFECIAFEKGEAFFVFFGILWLALGAKIFLNAFKRKRGSDREES